MRLFDLAEQYNDLMDVLEGSNDKEPLFAMLDGLEGAFDSKVESIVKLMQSKMATYTAIKTESDRLTKRADRTAKEIDWLEHYIESQMLATGKESVKSALFDIKLGLCPPAVNVLNESEIPRNYFITKPAVTTLDKRSLLESLKAGQAVSGAEIIQRKTLRIK